MPLEMFCKFQEKLAGRSIESCAAVEGFRHVSSYLGVKPGRWVKIIGRGFSAQHEGVLLKARHVQDGEGWPKGS